MFKRLFSKVTNTVSNETVMSLGKLPVGVTRLEAAGGPSITVFGATGFVSRYIFNELGRKGPVLTATVRGDDMEWRHLKPLCGLGKLKPVYFDLRDEDSVRDAIKGADVVINLAGKHYETKHILPNMINWNFEDLHVKGYETIARISREENVKHFVHLSSVATSAPEEDIKSRWVLTKKLGEDVIKTQFPGATIVKSNVIFGEEDRLINHIGEQILAFGNVFLFNYGKAVFRPVYVNDVATAISAIAMDYSFAGDTFELHGPHEYTYKEMVEYVIATSRRAIGLIGVPEPFEKYFGMFYGVFSNPRWTYDEILRLKQSNIPTHSSLTFADLGMKPSGFEKKGFNTAYKYKRVNHYEEAKEKEVDRQV